MTSASQATTPATSPALGQELDIAEAWMKEGREVAVATVVETWGSAPRPVGSHLVIDSQGRYRLRDGKEYVDTEARLAQGFLERANVQTVDELVEMIAAQRSFEMASQTFRLISESYQRLHR